MPVTVTEAEREHAWRLHVRLLELYGEVPFTLLDDPMRTLITTMLSQRTTYAEEKLAYDRMWAQFGSWEAIRDADTAALQTAIQSSNYPEVKAPNIQAVLRRIYDERGAFDLGFLADLPLEQAHAWLRGLPGVGAKTSALVLLYCFGQPVVPVDSHHHRVCQRIGVIGPKVSLEKAHDLMLVLLPRDPHVLYNFHRTTRKHGQKLCYWAHPNCAACPLKDMCAYFQSSV